MEGEQLAITDCPSLVTLPLTMEACGLMNSHKFQCWLSTSFCCKTTETRDTMDWQHFHSLPFIFWPSLLLPCMTSAKAHKVNPWCWPLIISSCPRHVLLSSSLSFLPFSLFTTPSLRFLTVWLFCNNKLVVCVPHHAQLEDCSCTPQCSNDIMCCFSDQIGISQLSQAGHC